MPPEILQAILTFGDKSLALLLLVIFIWRDWKSSDAVKDLVERNTEATKQNAIALTKLAERIVSRRGEDD